MHIAISDQFAGRTMSCQQRNPAQFPVIEPPSLAERVAIWRERFRGPRIMEGTVTVENGVIVVQHGARGTLRTELEPV